MTSAIATMPSSIGSGSTEHRNSPEAGPRGFTAINITPPHSRESSATSPDVSPRHGTAGAGRQGNNYYVARNDANSHKRRRSVSQDLQSPRQARYDYRPPSITDRGDSHQQQIADRALHALDTSDLQSYAPGRPPYGYNRQYGSNEVVYHQQTSPDGPEQYSRESSSNNGFDQKMEDGSKPLLTHAERKRKRMFANRVKTGCKTCRSRKKKCDEARPICNNCSKGGFICQGYGDAKTPGSWSKPMTPKQPVPLHSKEEDEQKGHADKINTISVDSSGNDVAQIKQSVSSDGHGPSRPQYNEAANPAESRPPQTAQQHQPPQWPSHAQQPPQASYTGDHLPPLNEMHTEVQQHPPRSSYSTIPHRDMSRPSNQPHSAPPVSALPGGNTWPSHAQQQQQPTSQPSYQSPQQQYGSRQAPYPPPIDTNQLSHAAHSRMLTANTANTASASYSSYEQKAGSKVFLNEDVERSRMLRGAPYNYFDTTLENERIRCSNALIRYNKLCKLSGTSRSETQAMLQQVFDPKKDSTYNPPAPCRIEGHLGPGVRIETGFDCTYGYNIRISDNVFIGKNTRIDDSAKVEIGARSWIAANVTILTNDVVKELVQRKGTDGQSNVAHSVWVGTEVVVGTGAVILPGVTIGRGCTIEPYAIVKTSLPDFTTAPSPSCAPMPSVSY